MFLILFPNFDSAFQNYYIVKGKGNIIVTWKVMPETWDSLCERNESKIALTKFVGLHSASPSNPLAQSAHLSTLCLVYRLFKLPFETMKDIQFH